MFGIAKEPLKGLGDATEAHQAAGEKLAAEHGPVIRDFLHAQWSGTQKDLGDAGLHHLTLYRAFHFHGAEPGWVSGAKAGDVIDTPVQRPLAPWSLSQHGAETAGTFVSGGHTVIVKSTVPREQLLSYPRSGVGCYKEGEFAVIDAPGSWEVVKA
jgi:hypothetical protein